MKIEKTDRSYRFLPKTPIFSVGYPPKPKPTDQQTTLI